VFTHYTMDAGVFTHYTTDAGVFTPTGLFW
jgi:hypothetical protein